MPPDDATETVASKLSKALLLFEKFRMRCPVSFSALLPQKYEGPPRTMSRQVTPYDQMSIGGATDLASCCALPQVRHNSGALYG